MEQRPLRLGDIVDDYCPRERRITNHAIVALVGDVIRQTRCATCDAEHVYKDGKAPRRLVARKRDEDVPAVTPAAGTAGPDVVAPAHVALTNGSEPDGDGAAPPQAAAAQEDSPPAEHDDRAVDGWLAHRPLIRATLPRTEGAEPPARPIPEFTMHQRQMRGGRAFRQAWHGGNGQPNGFRHDRQGQGGQGQGRHGGHGKSGRHRGGNNKRSR